MEEVSEEKTMHSVKKMKFIAYTMSHEAPKSCYLAKVFLVKCSKRHPKMSTRRCFLRMSSLSYRRSWWAESGVASKMELRQRPTCWK